MTPWQRLSSTQLVADQWIKLRADRCQLPTGAILDPYYVMEEAEWVHVVPVMPDGSLLLVEQFRYAAGVSCHEFPGGVVDPGESNSDAAARELREETGYVATTWQLLGSFYANPARQNNRVHVFLASDLRRAGEPLLDHGEEIVCRNASPEALGQMIADGRFVQGMHIASLYMALPHLRALKTGKLP